MDPFLSNLIVAATRRDNNVCITAAAQRLLLSVWESEVISERCVCVLRPHGVTDPPVSRHLQVASVTSSQHTHHIHCSVSTMDMITI